MAKFIDLAKILDWPKIVKEIKENREELVIKEKDKPVAVIIPFSSYQDWLVSKKLAKEKFFKLVNKIQERTKKEDPQKIEKLVNEAIREIRNT
ncbi:MAG: hypothetical protein DRN81_07575 [Thermoproteota archaeon]|nr:MAG: hypothetical protein DRN81_07575 [Candidatus Korarchaeota archaeon]